MESIMHFDSFTIQDVREVLLDIIEYVPYESFDSQTAWNKTASSFISQKFTVPPWHGVWAKYAPSKDRDRYMVETCRKLRKEAETPETYVRGIEKLLSPLVDCRVFVYGKEPGSFEDDFAYRTYQILKRLPSRPLELVGLPKELDERYFLESQIVGTDGRMNNSSYRTWSSLRITTCLNVNIIRLALYIVISGPDVFGHSIQDYPDLLAELLEISSGLASRCISNSDYREWYIVRASLWSSWQRTLMLCNYANLLQAVKVGYTGNRRLHIKFRNTYPAPGQSIHELSALYAANGKSNFMCSWAFELLRTGPICLSMDLRKFHQRYSQIWGNASARCRKDSPIPCTGNDPSSCWRFTGMKVEDQSAHDQGCSRRCLKLPWDETSYRSIPGARAVPVDLGRARSRNSQLQYCSISERTMAISHVWSHGQGGRPKEGVNSCLHERYIDVAQRLGCDSYWWDSACIPEDHDLRSEAIQNINRTFSSSKVVLVCDRDLMDIDVSDLNLQIKESILATVLVCDWNLRAWTFLESLKGRHNIHLLCKDNATVLFRDIIEDIAINGSIDVAILSFAVPHMLPENDGYQDSWSREEIGQVLSYRPASRQGDDVSIWSLLVMGKASSMPESLWHSKVHIADEYVQTGFLMSSSPRSNVRGFSWAPSTPYFKPQITYSLNPASSFRAFLSADTMPGQITERGLLAAWHVYEFKTLEVRESIGRGAELMDDQNQLSLLEEMSALYLLDSSWGALLRTVSSISTFDQDRDTSTRYNGLIKGTLVAVLGCNAQCRPSQKPAEERGWTWKGVFEWNENVPLPAFKEEYDFLIE